jgi:hypothetical protein
MTTMKIIWLAYLSIEHLLNNDGPICRSVSTTKDVAIVVIVMVNVFYIKSANVASIIHGDVCPLAKEVPLHVPNTMA